MGRMTDGDPLRDAVAELYSSDPDEFVQRRGALVARARAAGQAPVAKQIAGLRKPTRSAWIVNQLVRAVPGVASELTSLGEELRAAQGSLDGEALRELSRRRRELVESLVRQAFTAAGLHAPPAGVRDEVTATLGAALADPQVAGQLATGALERAVHSEGFGSAGPPALTLVKGTGGGAATRGAGPSRTSRTPRTPRTEPAPPADRARAERERAERERAERERAEREHRRRAAIAEAEQAAAEADRAAATATEAEQELEATVQRLEVQLADARRDLADARSRARRARARQHSARQALNRLRS
jgi:DNA repair exonuclease SbcCD ATPase subunit